MSLASKELDALMRLTRQEMIQVLCNSDDLAALSQEQQGEYLFGKLSNNRAVCLLWNDNNAKCVTSHLLASAYREIGR